MDLSREVLDEVDRVVERYPHAHSAILPVMHIIQREFGYIPPVAQSWVAERLEMSPSKVEEVLSFYTLLRRGPMGVRHLQVCRSLACYLRGEPEIRQVIQKRLGIEPGGKTEDGKFSLELVECLGSCGTAPVVQVNDDYFEGLTPEGIEELLGDWSK